MAMGRLYSVELEHWKCLLQGTCSFNIFYKSGKKTARWKALRLYHPCNYCPSVQPKQKASRCGQVWTPGQTPSTLKKLCSMFMLRVNNFRLSALDPHWRNSRKNFYRESLQQYKSAHVSPLTAQCHSKWPRKWVSSPCWNRTHVS